jgi:hypothetical protein
MKITIRSLSVLALAASLGACATVTRGTTTEFAVDSTPPGAAVKTSTGFSCPATPCSMKLPRKEAFNATVTKAGFKPLTMHIDSKVGGGGAAGFAGNVVAGGVLGMGIDAASGAMDDLSPNPLKVTLLAEDAAPAAAPPPAASPAAALPAVAPPAAAPPAPGQAAATPTAAAAQTASR